MSTGIVRAGLCVGELFSAPHECSNEYDRHAMAVYHDKELGAIVGHLPHEIPWLDELGDMTRLSVGTAYTFRNSCGLETEDNF